MIILTDDKNLSCSSTKLIRFLNKLPLALDCRQSTIYIQYIYIYIYIVTPRKIGPNLSKNEKVALKDLSKRDEIIIISEDKSGAVVIINVNDYIREAKCQINDSKNYNVLAKDPTTTNNDLVNQTIHRFTKKQLINENIANGLKNPSPGTPQHYISPPKIHKEGNPGRTVVSSINCHTTNISKYAD